MHDGKILFPMAEKRNYLVDVIRRSRCGGSDDGQIRFANPFQKRPIGKRTTGNFDDIETQFLHQIDARLIPRRTHGNETPLLDRIFQSRTIFLREFGFGKALDVFEIGPLDEIWMEESVIPVLELDAEMELLEITGDLFKFPDDAQAVFDVPHVIIGHFENEQGRWNGFDHALR